MQNFARFFLFAILLSDTAWAGAWLQPKGHGLFIAQTTYFVSDAFYDHNGKTLTQETYQKYETQPYLEYGLRDNLTVGGTGYWQYSSQSGRANTGIADPEIFVRSTLWSDTTQRLSLQPLFKFKSLYSKDSAPRSGSRSRDAELSLLYGRSLNLVSPRDYLDARLGYRYRSGQLHDQLRADIAVGVQVAPTIQLIPAIRALKSTHINGDTSFSENGDQDYDLVKLELGSSYALSPERALSLTAFDHITGRQTGSGLGISLGYLQRF